IVLRCKIEKPDGRNIINSEQIRPEFHDLLEVASSLFGRSKRLSVLVGRERTVGQTSGVKFVFPDSKEFAIDRYARSSCDRGAHYFIAQIRKSVLLMILRQPQSARQTRFGAAVEMLSHCPVKLPDEVVGLLNFRVDQQHRALVVVQKRFIGDFRKLLDK